MRIGRRGFTFIELLIAIVILAILAVIIYMLVFSSTQHSVTHTITTDLDDQCRIIMDQVTRDLRTATATSVAQGGGGSMASSVSVGGWTVSNQISFTMVGEFDPQIHTTPGSGGGYNPFTSSIPVPMSVAVAWAETTDEVVNGTDDNRNGMIDESLITRTSAGTTRILSRRGTARWISTSMPSGALTTSAPQWQPGTTPPGITFARLPAEPHVTVTVTLQGADSKGRRLIRSLTSTIALRN